MRDKYGIRLLGLGISAVFASMLVFNALAFTVTH